MCNWKSLSIKGPRQLSIRILIVQSPNLNALVEHFQDTLLFLEYLQSTKELVGDGANYVLTFILIFNRHEKELGDTMCI